MKVFWSISNIPTPSGLLTASLTIVRILPGIDWDSYFLACDRKKVISDAILEHFAYLSAPPLYNATDDLLLILEIKLYLYLQISGRGGGGKCPNTIENIIPSFCFYNQFCGHKLSYPQSNLGPN